MIDQDTLFELALKHNLVPDAMFYQWNMYGEWQRKVCDHFGGPRDRVIVDIGCGPLRFGAFVVQDIGNGHFHGIEPFAPYVAIGRDILSLLGAEQRATLTCSDSFELSDAIEVDFAMCHAVFTHLSYAQIKACLQRLAPLMRPGAAFVFTYNLSPSGRMVHRGRLYAEQMPLISVHLESDRVFHDFVAEHGGRFREFTEIPHFNQTCAVIEFA